MYSLQDSKNKMIRWQAGATQQLTSLNAQCVLALLMGAVRAERFCDGALLDFFKSGYILKWLERLQNIE